MTPTTIVLVHSPLVGPATWIPVAEILDERGIETLVPTLDDTASAQEPYWQQHAAAVARDVEQAHPAQPLILVGHSGAGLLLPVMRSRLPYPIAGYIFVDAGLPHHGWSRLDEMEAGSPEFGAEMRAHLEAGGSFPEWSDEDLREIIPDDRLRQNLLAELHPRALDFFEEPIPVPSGWPDAPCGYLLLSPAYVKPAAEARQKGWPYRELEAAHFHVLAAPEQVADCLVELVQLLGQSGTGARFTG